MTFHAPWLAALALLALPVGWALVARARRDRALRERIASTEILRRQRALPRAGLLYARPVLLSIALAAVSLALARPQAGVESQSVTGLGANILIVLDVSNSMLVADVSPDRYRRARYVVAAILDNVEPFDRVGLAAFSDKGVFECPLTGDLDVLVDRLVRLRVGELGEGSSDFIEVARLAARQFPNPDDPGLVVVLSDGEDHGNDLDEEALAELGRTGARIVTVGVGAAQGGPVPSGGLFDQYMRDSRGEIARSRLDERALRALAEATGGAYFEAPPGDVDALGRRIVSLARETPRTDSQRVGETRTGRELFQWPLLLAVLCLAADAIVPFAPAVEKRRKR